MQILDAADHAELAAEISATGVNRIALSGDRIAKVVRSPDGFAVEHDAASGDLYLRPVAAEAAEHDPVTLFVGTERGFTYRLTLTPSDRDSAQILIRNAAALPGNAGVADPACRPIPTSRRWCGWCAPSPGAICCRATPSMRAGKPLQPGLTLIETWRGPRLAALVFEAARPASKDAGGAAGLAGTIGSLPGVGPVAALWLAPPATGPSGGRLGVAVVETAGAGGPQ